MDRRASDSRLKAHRTRDGRANPGRVLLLALVALGCSGCTQNGASVTESADLIVVTTTGSSASLFALVGAVVSAVINVMLWRAAAEGLTPKKRGEKLLITAFLAGITLFYACTGASRPVFEVSGAQREVRFKETLLGLVVQEKKVSANRIRSIVSRKFHRSGKWKKGDWGSLSVVTLDGDPIEYEASQEFPGQVHGLAARMGKMLGVPAEETPR